MARMIRRRRNVIMVVLLLGLAWFVVVPLISRDGAANESKQNFKRRHSNYKFDNPEDLDSSRALKEVLRNRQIHSPGVNDASSDDLSEIEYPQTEFSQNIFQKVKFHPVDTSFPVIRSNHFTPTKLLQSFKINSSFKEINSPGHKGRMVQIDPKSLSSLDREIYDSGWKKYYHNEYVNSMISPQRVLLDVRDPGCRSLQYSIDKLDTSVVIVVHNEAWMTLLRTIHSVLDRSPTNVLREIILVDDASTVDHMGSRLTKYVSHVSKVRVVRLELRRGASYARRFGASIATGSVIVFLDAHCECTKGWLEPLLSHIATNSSNVAVPVIDQIDDDTFAYRAYDASRIRIGGFDWTLAYQWIEIPEYEKRRRSNNIDPIRNPVMWGGIFAINRDFFNHLNGYNQSLDMLGEGHNIEMSFRIWLCGGTIQTIPCSHVGHVFHTRKATGQLSLSNEALKNYAAVAYMWLDEFKDLHFQRMGYASPPQVNSTVSHLAFRERLQCHPFDWFLRNVFRNLYAPSLALASGIIRSKLKISSTDKGRVSVCLALINLGTEMKLDVSNCRPLGDKNKMWFLSRTGEIRNGDNCLDFPGNRVVIYSCHGGRGNQEWSYREDRTIQQVGTKRCLTLSADGKSLMMEDCTASDLQIWFWKRNYEGESTETQKHVAIKQELASVVL